MEETALSGFGDILKAYRKQRKINQQELASRLNVHRNTIGKWERGDYMPESKTMVLELARQLHLTENETYRLLEASLTAITPYWNIPYQRNPFFNGRDDLLQILHAQLRTEQTVALCQSYALSGLGGIGKTQVAVEYVYRYYQEYASLLWIEAETYETILSSFVSIATLLNLAEKQDKDQNQIVASVLSWFNNHSDWLLVFDNVEDVALLKRFLPTARKGAILLTSRMRTVGTIAQSLEVKQMSVEVGTRFLLQRAKLIDLHGADAEQISPDDLVTARAIVEALDGLPLALDQAGAYIDETQCSLQDFLTLFQAYPISLLKERDARLDHPLSVEKTFSLAFEKIQHANPSSLDLLTLCSFLSPIAIPEEVITKGVLQIEADFHLLGTDPLYFHSVLKQLLAYSLIRRNAQEKTLLLHRLVQSVLRSRLRESEQVIWAERAIQIVNAVFPTVEFSTWSLCEQLLPHALTCLEHLEHLTQAQMQRIYTLDVSSLMTKAADYLTARARYGEAELLFQKALHAQSLLPDPEQLDKASILIKFGKLLTEQGKYEQSELYLQQSLTIREGALGSERADVANSLNTLAELYRRQGKYQHAEIYFQRALDIYEQVHEPENLEIAKSLYGLASVYGEQGKYEQSEPLFQRSLHIQEAMLGSEHPDVALVLVNLAIIYAMKDEYEQAEHLLRRALSIQEQIFGLEHPKIAYCLNNLAELSKMQGKYGQAESFSLRTLHIREKALGLDHYLVAYPLNILANIYGSQGKYERVEPLLLRSLSIREHALEPDHPDIAISLTGLAGCYKMQKMYEQSEIFFLRAFRIWEKPLLLEHPDGIEALDDLVDLYQVQGKYDQAEDFLQRALHIREEVFSSDHATINVFREKLQKMRESIEQNKS